MAAKHGKKYREVAKQVDETKVYQPAEAIELLRSSIM